MKAIVMAGGQGTRLRPLTVERPKPLLPLVNKPVISHIVDWLRRYGVEEIVVTLQHQAEWFQNYLSSGANQDIHIEYLIEDVPLGTAGGIALALADGLISPDESVLVVSGDVVTDFDIRSIITYHHDRQADVTVALHRVSNPLEYGMVITEADGRITQFVEKPGWAEVVSDLINTGIYVLEAKTLAMIPIGVAYDFSNDLFPRLMEQNKRIYGCPVSGYWCDVGTPAAYLQANSDILAHIVEHEPLGEHIGGEIWTGENVQIAPDAELYGPIYLGNNVQIKGGVIVHGPAVIRDDTVVDSRVNISHTVIWRGCYIGEDAEIHGAVISRQCVFKRKVLVREGAVVGDRCTVGEGAVIGQDVKLWPAKEIESGAIVRNSIVWGSRGRRVLFSRFGVTGVVNVDLTPEFCAKLGVAFGASLPKGSMVTINRDTHPSSRMLKRAIISGLPAAGIQVWDLRTQPVPVARFTTRMSDAQAGVHVRISPHDRRVVDISFMAADGLDLGRAKEREVERLFFREDFRRAQLDDIGTIDYAPDVEEQYAQAFLQRLDCDCIQNAHANIAVDYAHATTVDVLEPLLAELDVEVVGLNTRVDAQLLSILEREWEHGMEQLARIVHAMGLQFGARLDVSGSKVFLVDDQGRLIHHTVAAAIMADLVWREQPGAMVAVPVDRPAIFERLAAQYGGQVLRTKVDLYSLMTAAAHHSVPLAADGHGHFISSDFDPVPDGMFALARLTQYLAKHEVRLSELAASLPRFEWLHETIPCSWDAKGRVMRRVNEEAASYDPNTVDGVKFFLDNEHWVLVRPDPDRASLHIYVEAPTIEDAERLMSERVAWVQSLERN
ncbi:MAG: NTP transferase domain-containing protein [Caldilineales bacterium]|nr:NTP transferase domain-containing protein [Caldilineales bacterium]